MESESVTTTPRPFFIASNAFSESPCKKRKPTSGAPSPFPRNARSTSTPKKTTFANALFRTLCGGIELSSNAACSTATSSNESRLTQGKSASCETSSGRKPFGKNAAKQFGAPRPGRNGSSIEYPQICVETKSPPPTLNATATATTRLAFPESSVRIKR